MTMMICLTKDKKMVFNFLKKKDPMCGMTEEKGRGITNNGNWFCSENCKTDYEKKLKSVKSTPSCCH